MEAHVHRHEHKHHDHSHDHDHTHYGSQDTYKVRQLRARVSDYLRLLAKAQADLHKEVYS